MRRTSSPWLVLDELRRRPRLRLFCFPYAGGGTTIFRGWSEFLPEFVEVCCVELPGRGTRMSEQPYTRLLPLAHDLTHALVTQPTGSFAFFGHSMGALLSFEIARMLRDRRTVEPVGLFVSGCLAPQVFRLDPPIHGLPDAEFLNELRRLNGSPADVLAHEELMHFLLPTLRADFAMCETYEYVAGRPLDCPIRAFGGRDDREVAHEDILGWNDQTTASFSLSMLDGDHFFVSSARTDLLRVLSKQLKELATLDGKAYAS